MNIALSSLFKMLLLGYACLITARAFVCSCKLARWGSFRKEMGLHVSPPTFDCFCILTAWGRKEMLQLLLQIDGVGSCYRRGDVKTALAY